MQRNFYKANFKVNKDDADVQSYSFVLIRNMMFTEKLECY